MLNFFVTNVVLGVALGFSILRHVPNTFRGVQLPPLAAKIKVKNNHKNLISIDQLKNIIYLYFV